MWSHASHCSEFGPKGGSTWEDFGGLHMEDVLMSRAVQTHRGWLLSKVVSTLSLEKSTQDMDVGQEMEGT